MVEDRCLPLGLLDHTEPGHHGHSEVCGFGYAQACFFYLPYNSVLEKAGFIKAPEGGFTVDQFVNTDVAKLA